MWLYVSLFVLYPVRGDVGMISYFEEECPEGWEQYTNLNGRFAVGAGEYSGASLDNRKENYHYGMLDEGGEIKHLLNQEETPKSSTMSKYADRYCEYDPNACATEGVPHNNLPPYLALRSCQRKTGQYEELLAQLQETQKTIKALNDSLSQKINELSEQSVSMIRTTELAQFRSSLFEINRTLENSLRGAVTDEYLFASSTAVLLLLSVITLCILLFLLIKNKGMRRKLRNQYAILLDD